ncbi:MAG: O-antigen ligase family protein [Lysobacteraceae bacterium]
MTPTTTTDALPAPAGWRWAPFWVLAYVVLWPVPGIAEGLLSLGSLVAIGRLLFVRFRGGGALLSPQAWALTSVLFFAYWLPELFASFDAADRGLAFGEVATDLRYLPFLWLAASAVADTRGRRITFGGLAVIVGVWTLDALAQAVSGTSVLFSSLDAAKLAVSGHRFCSANDYALLDRLSGVLGPCNLKLGVVFASLSPFALHVAGRRFGQWGWLLAAVLVGSVIVLAGSRASWITFGLVLLLSGWRLLGWKRLFGVFALGGVLLAAMTFASPQVRERIERTAHALTADQAGVDSALSGRGRIWSAALCMAKQHPVNGVGPRGFREAFPACDPEHGAIAEWGIGPAFHAHQIVLEILSETGVIGLLLWLSAVAMARRAWRYAEPAAREAAYPAMLALTVTVFPLNTHLAFYSTFWGGATLLLAALFAGSLLARDGIR